MWLVWSFDPFHLKLRLQSSCRRGSELLSAVISLAARQLRSSLAVTRSIHLASPPDIGCGVVGFAGVGLFIHIGCLALQAGSKNIWQVKR